MRKITFVAFFAALLTCVVTLSASEGLTIHVTVKDVTTGKMIKPGQMVHAGDLFQVTVTTNGVDCAGQFVVTALGASGAPPSVLVQSMPFIIGPATGSNSVTGGELSANSMGSTGTNDWKVTASCNGPVALQIAYGHMEFYVPPAS